ncbi:MAG: GNAT family N-acetyltransferase [Methanomicrobiales archaeon]|nr:GNAT family N-acetyltransferase [Methanomicrobiales archaeon]
MQISLEPVADHPALFDTIAGWLWSEWGTAKNKELYRSLVAHSQRDGLPSISVALAGTTPVGTVGLLRTDLLSRQEFTPWMAVLYVQPAWRSTGIATLLQKHVVTRAQDMGYKEIFLYTKMTGYYEKNGWVYRESDYDDHGEVVRIYRKTLDKK